MFDCLKSDPNPSSKRKLTNETESALVKVDESLNDQLIRINITKIEIKLFLPQNIHLQDACDKKAHWFHLPVTPRKIVLSYPSLVAQLIIKQKKGSVELFGKEVTNILIPFNEDQLQVFYKIVMIGKLP